MRYLLIFGATLLLGGCGFNHGGGGGSAPFLDANGDLVLRGNGLVVITPPNTVIHNIDITGDGDAVTVGTSSTVTHGVFFHGSSSEVHLPVSLEFILPLVHQDSGDGNHVYFDSTAN